MDDLYPQNKKDKCDSVCGSNIKYGSNSYINSDSDGDSDDDETKYDDGFESEMYTEGELYSDGIQEMVCSLIISDKKYSCDHIGVPECAIEKGVGDNSDK